MLRVALVHDWLVTFGGAERVLKELTVLFPRADIFTIVDFLPDSDRSFLQDRLVYTSFIQKLPSACKRYRLYLGLMPYAIESFDLTPYDLVISSSHAVAKGVLTGPDQLHLCLCHSPIRYAWDMQHEYLRQVGMDKGLRGLLSRILMHRLRLWDVRTAHGVDAFIAVSNYISRRIKKVYGRGSKVIYPPVDLSAFSLSTEKEDFYLAASRLVPYKRIDLIVEAFNHMPGKRLIVIGDGPEFKKIKKLAGPNIKVLGFQPNALLRDYMQRARGFIFAAKEDFGIIPLEAMASGTPVIAYGRGGALETVTENTGTFFYEQTWESLVKALNTFEQHVFCPYKCREQAEGFAVERWRQELLSYVNKSVEEWSEKIGRVSAG